MDITDDNLETKKCFKCNHQLFDNVNVAFCASSSTIFLWNKYQILAYDNLNFESSNITFIPEFQIQQLIVSNNYLICLDCSGNVHIISLKFKHSANKRLKTTFQPRQQGVLSLLQYNQDYILTLKLESDNVFLNLHKINTDFQLCRATILRCKEDWPLNHVIKEKCIMSSLILPEEDFLNIKSMFKVQDDVWKEYSIVLISFDQFSVYSCLYNPKAIDDDISLLKLYTCPSQICSIEITVKNGSNILIGLTTGTLIRLSLKDTFKTPEIIHLNTALHKLISISDTVLYTDGITMWKTENTFSHYNIKFYKLFVRQVKDFINIGDQLICTTFTNLIYAFSIEDETVYLKPESVDEYCSAEKLLNNSEYLYKIMEEIERNKELIKRVNEEGNYIMALSLSNRQDIMDTVIHLNIIVYDNYEDVLNDYQELVLSQSIEQYFDTEAFLVLIEITTSEMQHMFSNVLSNLLGDLKIHITISTEGKILKTSSIKIKETLKKINILIPLSRKELLDVTKIKVGIKIVSNMPGAFDKKQTIWMVLYRKVIVLSSEYFLKTNLILRKNICYKDIRETVEELIQKTVNLQHGHLFKVTDVSKLKSSTEDWSLYLKLPENYQLLLKNKDCHLKYFNKKKSNFLLQQFTAEEFLKSKSNLCFEIGNDKVKIEIIQEFSVPLLKVTCQNIKLAFNIRNFFSNLIYDDYKGYGPGKEYVTYAFYTTVENHQKALKNCMAKGLQLEEILPLAKQFERSIFASLPL